MGSVLHARILNVAGRHYRIMTDPQTYRNVGRMSASAHGAESEQLQEGAPMDQQTAASPSTSNDEPLKQHEVKMQVDNAV